jgi:hypothetical protein
MVATFPICPELHAQVMGEIGPLLPCLHDYTDIQAEPRILLLRNPHVPSAKYATWQKNHRFGHNTCPGVRSPCWTKGGAIDHLVRLSPAAAKDLLCVSAMVISYSQPGGSVGYHRDPCAYARIVSATLKGGGVMKVKRGRNTVELYDLVPGLGIALDDDDCLFAKHCVESSERLALVLRYISQQDAGAT